MLAHHRRTQRIEHQTKSGVARSFTYLQQTPLRVNDPSLHPWNARPAAIPLAFIGFTFIVGSFVFVILNGLAGGGSGGLAVGTLWVYLVISWLWVPTFTRGELKSTIRHANRQDVVWSKITHQLPIPPTAGAYPHSATVTRRSLSDLLNRDGLRLRDAPVFNYSRFMLYPNRMTLGRDIYSSAGTRGFLISEDDSGLLNRDELQLRGAPAFNHSRSMLYRDRMLNRDISGVTVEPAGGVVFQQRAFVSVFNASTFAVVLQLGTIAVAVIPKVGLGHRSLVFIIYGGTASLTFLLLVLISTIFHNSESRAGPSTTAKGFTASISIALRRLSPLLAFINTAGLIVMTGFQLTKFLVSHYYNAGVIGRRTSSYIIITFGRWISAIRTTRIAAPGFTAASMTIFTISLWLHVLCRVFFIFVLLVSILFR